MAPSVGSAASITGLLVFGTTTSLLAKIVYELRGEGSGGEAKYFVKPWTMVTVMFLGMSLSLPLAYMEQWAEEKKAKAEGATPLLEKAHEHSGTWREVFMLGIPTFFDLVATILMNVGLVSVTASVYQMLRGAEMLFAALFAVVFLGRKLNRFHYGGIACCLVGISLVGVASLMSGEGSATHPVTPAQMLLGMGLIVASQSVQAAQITYEDFFMADLNIAPLKIVGFEGLWGSVTMLFVILPIVYFLPGAEGHGLHENTLDTLYMIRHSPVIGGVLLFDMFALLMYNFSGMCVTGHLGAVFRTVLETMRTLFVWLVDLFLFYGPLGLKGLGESWGATSWIQAGGFVVLVSGTLIYSRGDDEDMTAHPPEEAPAVVAEPEQPADVIRPVPKAPSTARQRPSAARAEPIAMSPGTSFYKSSMSLASFSPLSSSVSRSYALSSSHRGAAQMSVSHASPHTSSNV
ncbi:hypothetical protein KFL_001070060 [Klebsormidium nitens]|uniref:EamA domain-containing protein n=1 Tax=Klebsormidium nitens TaxID=105231 RepID=A0A1Y1HUJ1_KLENI|nr:hypothetical protein KFL_001070060 [Klebsormidium nitens]|eukprot:GAQ82300.1 hypothetical protein KFL_001070060 [Klebsormidium nitens]